MPQLRVLLGHQQGRVFSLDDQPLVIGRHPKAQIILHPDSPASRQHAELYPDAGEWRLRDLGSRNGTELNGRQARDEALVDRDEIVIGENVFVFEQGEGDDSRIAEAASLASAAEQTGAHNQPSVHALVHEMDARLAQMRREAGRVLPGHGAVIRELLTAVIARGHVLLSGVPGMAKMALIRAAAAAMGLGFERVRFTPALMPEDVCGREVPSAEPGGGRFEKGPIFTNVFLAEDIQQAAARTSACVFEAMRGRRASLGGRSLSIGQPFVVVAAQNLPGIHAGGSLSAADADHFMFSGDIGYPSAEEEERVVRFALEARESRVGAVFTAKEIAALQAAVADMPVCDHVVRHAVRLVRATRPGGEGAPAMVEKCVVRGACPHGAEHLVVAAKARAVVSGRLIVSAADVREVAHPVLRHRLTLREGTPGVDEVLAEVIEAVGEPVE